MGDSCTRGSSRRRWRVTYCFPIWSTRGIMGLPRARGEQADRNWERTISGKTAEEERED